MSKVTIGIKIAKWWYGLYKSAPHKEKTYARPSNHLQLLGLPVRDKVTGMKGVCSSVVYDLYGCIQGAITPEVDSAGKPGTISWYDVTRIEVLGKQPVVTLPDFAQGYVAEGKKGSAEKPVAY